MQSQVQVKENSFTDAAAVPEIRNALRRYGITVGAVAPAQATACIQGRPAPVRRDLLAALDECLRLVPKEEAATRQWLLDTLTAADSDSWRVRVRQATARGDGKTLQQLARVGDVARQPPSFLLVLAFSLPAQLKSTRLELLRRTQRAYPGDLWANHALAFELMNQGQPAEAIRYCTAALALRPINPGTCYNLAKALQDAGELEPAIAAYRQALALAPQYPSAHINLGNLLQLQGKVDEAIECYRQALALDPRQVLAHCNLGVALIDKGKVDEAIACYRQALALDPGYAKAHYNLGLALKAKGKVDEAIVCFRQAIALLPRYPRAHYNLGAALQEQGKVDEAIACYRQALALDPRYARAYYNLGNALKVKGKVDEAIACYRKVLELDPRFAEAHCNLGHALRDQGRFREALACFRRGHALGSPTPAWRYPSADWAQQCQRQLELDRLLSDFLAGVAEPASVRERLELATFCQLSCKRLHLTAVRLVGDAVILDPRQADDPQQPRYNTASSAALAAARQANDARFLPDKLALKLRRQALHWLLADLARFTHLAGRNDPGLQATLRQRLTHWHQDPDLASLRDAKALARLDPDERQQWQRLWHDVDALLRKVAPPP